MKKGFLLKVSLLSVSLLVASAPAINANIPTMAKAFEDVPLSMVEMLSTIPSMFLMISVLTSSFIARRFGYKQTILLGLIIVSICGILPVFISNFYIVLASRAMFGFGIGLFNSLLVSMISYFYDGDEKSSLFGIQSACEGLGGMAITFTAGQLLKINWQAPFYAYLIAIPVVFFFVTFVPKVSTEKMLEKTGMSKQKERGPTKGIFTSMIGYIALIFVVAILYMTMGIKVASLMTSAGYASASDASTVIMLLSLGSMIAGFTFGKIIKVLKEYTLPIAFIILASAMCLIGLSNTTTMTVIAGFLVGFGFRMVLPYLINKINTSNIPNTSLATSLLLVGYNLGVFITPYGSMILQSFVGDNNLRGLFYVDAIGFIILAIGALVFTFYTRKKVA